MTQQTREREFDYVIVGGGTAGAVIAARLAEDSQTSVALLEAGPADEGVPEIMELSKWQRLLEMPEYGRDFRLEPQARGNTDIRHSRGIMLGGCSSHNSAISFRATPNDLETWESLGAAGWGPESVEPYFERVAERVHTEESGAGNSLVADFISAAGSEYAADESFGGRVREGAGLFRLAKRGPRRQSSSVAYLHPLDRLPENLSLHTHTRARKVLFESERASGVETSRGTFHARREVVLCAGAFDTPRLLMLSGIGPRERLRELGIGSVADAPGVGENLQDHPEGVVIWETNRPVPEETANRYEAGHFATVDEDAPEPDLMFHLGLEAFDLQTGPKGYPTSERAFSLTPNVARARSRGAVRLRSADPEESPLVDFRYFTDPEGYDERIMVEGIRLARELVRRGPLSGWVERELSPGPAVVTDAELSEYARRTANTVYHPAGTCRMGSPNDPDAVVDPELRVRGVEGLRVSDASIFPTITTANPCNTVLMIGERAADLIRGEPLLSPVRKKVR